MGHVSRQFLLPLLVILQATMRVTLAQVPFLGPCPPIPSMKGFDPIRFLGRWYEIERFFVSYEQLAGTCWVENYLYTKGRGHYTRLDWKDRISGRVLSIENDITINKREPARLRYVVARPNIPFLSGEYQILHTDYEDYALAWQCQNVLDLHGIGGHTEILWLLSKHQFPDKKVIQTAKSIAKGRGLKIDRLEKQDRSACPP